MTANVSSENYSVPNIFTPPLQNFFKKSRSWDACIRICIYRDDFEKAKQKKKSLRRVYFFLKWSLIKSVTLTWCFHFPCHKQYIKFE